MRKDRDSLALLFILLALTQRLNPDGEVFGHSDAYAKGSMSGSSENATLNGRVRLASPLDRVGKCPDQPRAEDREAQIVDGRPRALIQVAS